MGIPSVYPFLISSLLFAQLSFFIPPPPSRFLSEIHTRMGRVVATPPPLYTPLYPVQGEYDTPSTYLCHISRQALFDWRMFRPVSPSLSDSPNLSFYLGINLFYSTLLFVKSYVLYETYQKSFCADKIS